MNCHACGDPLPKDKHQCPSCKTWTWQEQISLQREIVYWEDLGDKPLQRLSLGILDECLCGGVVISDVILIGGGPGAGKSTLLWEVCSQIWKHGVCLYVGAEEDQLTVKARGKRLGKNPPPKRMAFYNAMGGGTDLGAVIIESRPAGIIIDSLNGLVGGDLAAEIRALEILKQFCVQLQAPAVVISQVNADLDFSGLMAKQHAVDVLLRLTKDPDVRTENGEQVRILESRDKNRNGRVGIETYLEMSETGLYRLDTDECSALGLLEDEPD